MWRITFAALALSACTTLPVLADDIRIQSIDGTITFSGSYGLASIKANEYVYERKAKVSQLIWESRYVNTFNGALHVELPKQWYLDARGSIGLGGDGHMADFDWLQPGKSWSDRSLHPDTRLNHYYVASLEIGRELLAYDGTEIGLGAGFKYTDVKWSAWGGSYVYSENGFRDSRGEFDPSEKGISYRQAWPVPYLGANLSHHEGDWTFASSLQAGLAINSGGIDDHWVRNLRFHDYFETTPTVSLSGSIEYAAWDNAAFFVSGSFDKMFRVRADTKMVDTVTGDKQWFRDGAGGDYLSTTVSLGLKGRF